MKILESVGCFINDEGYTYPALEDGDSFDELNECHITDCSYEWYKSLSVKDKLDVDSIYELNSPRKIPLYLLVSINKVLDMYYQEEYDHYDAMCTQEEAAGHIFHGLENIRVWINNKFPNTLYKINGQEVCDD